jgi:hypothetical protein
VSLADQKRLRKLRKTEEDTQVDGHELQTRLKKQYDTRDEKDGYDGGDSMAN